MKKSVSFLLMLALLLIYVPSLAANAEITAVTLTALSDGNIGVSVTAKNASGAYLLAAGYSEDGSMLSSSEVSGGSAVLSGNDIRRVKIFCWSNSQDLLPLCPPYEAKYIPEGAAELEGVIVSAYSSNPYRSAADDSVTMIITKSSDSSLYAVGEEYALSAGDLFISPLLGHNVTALVRESKMLSVSETPGLNSALTLDAYDIDSLKTDLLSYYPSPFAKYPEKAAVESTLFGIEYDNIIINGFESSLYPIDFDIFTDFPLVDEVTFLDNDLDGSFEFIFADVFTSSTTELPVKSVEITDSGVDICGLSGTYDYYADLLSGDIYTVIKDGSPASFEDIEKGDVVTVLDDEVYSKTLHVSSRAVNGMIEQIGDNDVFTISGTELKVSSHSESLGNIYRYALSLGDKGTFYTNYLGRIVYFEPLFDVSYVYVIDAASSQGSFGTSEELIRVITSEGAHESLTLNPKRVDVYSDIDYVLKNLTAGEANDEVKYYLSVCEYGFIAQIGTDESGAVTEIHFPGSERFTYTDKYISDAEDKTRYYSEQDLSYGSVAFNSDAVLFDIDINEENLENAVTVHALTDVFKGGVSYSFSAYGIDISEKADAAVSYGASLASAAEPAEPSFEDSDYIYAIDCDSITDSYGSTSCLVKAVTLSGDINIYTIAQTHVYVFNGGDTAADIDGEAAYACISGPIFGSAHGMLLRVTTAYSGCINGIWFPGCAGFDYGDAYANDAEAKSASYSAADFSYGSIKLKGSTAVFNIDTTEENLENAVSCFSVNTLLKDGSSYSFTAYGEDLSAAAEVLVTLNADTSSLGVDPHAPVMVVTAKTSAAFGDGDITTCKLTGVMNGSSVSVIVDPNEAGTAEAVVKGNIIIFSENSDGLAQNIHILFDSDKTSLGELHGVNNIISANPAAKGSVNIAFGEIAEKSSSYFSLEGVCDEYGDPLYYTEASEGCRFILVEKAGNDITVTPSSFSAVKYSTAAASCHAFVKTTEYGDEVTDTVIFKGFNR